MRNRFDGSRRGRRPDRPGSAPTNSSPYGFGSGDDETADPVDMMAIRADDELLDALASGEVSFGGLGGFGSGDVGSEGDLPGGFHDDQQMLAMLAAWRDDVLDEPVPELVSVERAAEAIAAGRRDAQPRRRLMPVAAAAAAVVLGLSGVAIGAGSAQPGDPLWGVAKGLNSERAASTEAAQRVSVALASVQQALDEGRVSDAQATLAAVAPELAKVTDQETKNELASKQANLANTAADTKEGVPVHTDEFGKPHDNGKSRGSLDNSSTAQSSESGPSDATRKGRPGGGQSGPASSPRPAPELRRSPLSSSTPPPPETTRTPPADKPPPGKSGPPGSGIGKWGPPKSGASKSDEPPKGEGDTPKGEDSTTPTAQPATPPPGRPWPWRPPGS